MYMTEQHIKEQLSKAYANAIAANAGMIFRDYGNMDYGLDGKFSDVDLYRDNKDRCRYSETGYGIEFQLKATVNIVARSGTVYYDLEMKNYLDLIRTDIGTQRILIIYSLPKERDKWLEINDDGAILHRCAWWCSLRGKPHESNRTKVRIEIPERQLFTSEELKRLIELVKGGNIL